MTRTSKFRKNKDFIELEPDYSLPIYFDESLRSVVEAETMPASQKRWFAHSGRNFTPSELESYKVQAQREKLIELNMEQARNSRATMSKELNNFLEFAFRLKYAQGGKRILMNYLESKFFSLVSLSKFLETTTYETYGDYLDEHWDTNYEDVLSLTLPDETHTNMIAQQLIFTDILSVDETIPKQTRQQIEALTKEEIIFILQQETRLINCSKASISKKLNILLQERQTPTKSKSPLEVMNQLAFFLSKALIGNDTGTIQNYSAILVESSCHIKAFSRKVPSDIKEVSASELSYKELEPVIDFLVEHSDEFDLAEASAIIYSFNSHKVVMRSGSLTDYFTVLNSALERPTPEKTVNVFKFISDLVMTSSATGPTFKELHKAVKDGMLDEPSAADLTLILISVKSEAYNYMPSGLDLFRKVFKPKTKDARS